MKALAMDDPRVIGEYRLRARLGAGGMGRVYLGLSPAGRAVAIKVVHPDLASEAAQKSLTALLGPKYRLRFLRSQPDAQHAMVLAEAAAADTLDPPGRLARRILRRAHGKVGNAWREGLIDASREFDGGPLTKRDARAMAEAAARQPDVLDTRLIDLPRHQIARVLEDATTSAGTLGSGSASESNS